MFNDFADQFWAQSIDGLAAGSIYGLIALGYTMVYGVLRLINFAHSEIFMIGTFSSLLVVTILGVEAPLGGVALLGTLALIVLGGTVGSGGAAVALEWLAYRPLRRRGASRLAALISAIGASLFLQELFALLVIPEIFDRPQHGRDIVSFPRVMDKEHVFSVGGEGIRNDKVLVFATAVVMMIVLDVLVRKSKIGRGIRATAQDPQTAVLMGVDIDKVVRVTFLVGGVMAGVAASLYVVQFENTQYNIGFLLGIKAFTAAVLGGIGNLRGALLGGLALGLVENYGSALFGSDYKDVMAFAVLVVVLMLRPMGILGESLQQARA